MGILKLLADMMMWVLRAPYVLLNYVYLLGYQRMATARVAEEAGKELSTLGKVFRVIGLILLWLVLVSILVAALVGLWYLNDALSLPRYLAGPWPAARPYWLPLLLILFCGSCFVGYRLYRSLGPEQAIVEFDDIEEAWTQARSALVEAGIDLTAVPVYLVLGRNASGLHTLLSASRLTFQVQQVPLKANAPVQVYANRQAIFVTAPDASLLGRQAELLLQLAVPAEPEVGKPGVPLVFDEPAEPASAEQPAPPPPEPKIDPMLATENLLADPGAGAGVAVLPAPAAPPVQTAQTEALPWETEGRRQMPALVHRAEEMERYQSRLRYLLRRIGRDRSPYCPLNGVLLLLPLESITNPEDASVMATLCQTELQAIQQTARMRCPVFVLVPDLETSPGYAALAKALDPDRRSRLLGQDLPLSPDLKPEDLPAMVAGSVQHFNRALGQWLLRLFRVEKTATEPAADCIADNSNLFELLSAVRLREPALERILTRLLDPQTGDLFFLGGFYLAATGANPDRDQAFVPGVFQKLVQSQNAVAWTDEALAEEADYQRWTMYGYAALAIFCIAVAVIVYGRWQMLR
jgi:hypothetical protein